MMPVEAVNQGDKAATPLRLQTQASTERQIASTLHVHIRDALMKTDITDCWGNMAGVLFWIALVAGAAANPGATPRAGHCVENVDQLGTGGDAEEARTWLAAILVRCSIVLGFEYGPSMMETVKTMVAVQRELERGSATSEASWESESQPFVERSDGLPPVFPQGQQGFADFARDFLACSS